MQFHWVFVGLILFHSSLSADHNWNYGNLGPDVWPDFNPTCAGTAQSPINIKTACTIYESYEPFQFSSGYDLTQDFTLTNNGHSISAEPVDKTKSPLTLTGGGLSEEFMFASFHLHWGKNYKTGSEHLVNSKKYAGEIHFVHTDAAQTQYAVLGIFMQSSGPSTKTSKSHRGGRKKGVVNTDKATIDEWDKVFKIASQLHTTGSSAVASLELSTLMGTNLENFYRYSGSLTTPPCSETVTWTVFQKPIQFVNSQLESFRKIILENHRGPQLSYGRPVYRSFEDDEISEIPDNNVCVLPVDDKSNEASLDDK